MHGTTAVDRFLAKQVTQEQWQAQVRAAKAFAAAGSLHAGKKMTVARAIDRFKSFRSPKAGVSTVK